MMRKTCLAVVAVIVAMSLVLGCGGPEEKKAKFFDKAKELFERGDLVRARLEVKNALQIDPKFAEGYRLLGQIEMQAGDFKAAYGAFGKAVELNPEVAGPQIELGRMLLASGAPDKALERAQAVLAREPQHPEAPPLQKLPWTWGSPPTACVSQSLACCGACGWSWANWASQRTLAEEPLATPLGRPYSWALTPTGSQAAVGGPCPESPPSSSLTDHFVCHLCFLD